MTEHNVEVLTARLVDLDAQIEELQAQREDTVAALTDAVEVGGRLAIGDTTYYRVQQNKPFDVKKARKVLPPEIVALCVTVETVEQEVVDKDRLRALAEGLGLLDQCVNPSKVFVNKVDK